MTKTNETMTPQQFILGEVVKIVGDTVLAFEIDLQSEESHHTIAERPIQQFQDGAPARIGANYIIATYFNDWTAPAGHAVRDVVSKSKMF